MLEECWPCPVFAGFTLAFALQLRKKHGKTSVRVTEDFVKFLIQKKRTRRLRIRRRGIRSLVRLTVTQHNKVLEQILSRRCRWAHKLMLPAFISFHNLQLLVKKIYVESFIRDNFAHSLFSLSVFYQRVLTPTASILSFTVFDPVARGSTFLRNVDRYLQTYTPSHTKRPWCAHVLLNL